MLFATMTDVVRTPEEALEGLPDFPFSSRYRDVDGLRLAHLDEGEGKIQQILEDSAIAEDLAWAAYGRELVRRTEFTSQGIGVLVLWREIAWDSKGRIKAKFKLAPVRMIAAEKKLIDRIVAGDLAAR